MAGITFGILIVSDSRSEGSQKDEAGPELKRLVSDINTGTGKILKGKVLWDKIIPDKEEVIMEYLVKWSDVQKLDVILTSGGTGFSDTDVTPEATKKVIEKEAPGIATAMLVSSLQVTPMAALSRAMCGIRGKTLIINLPGSPKALKECLAPIASVIPHAVDLISNKQADVERVHASHDLTKTNINDHSCDLPATTSLHLENIATRLRESPYPMLSVDKAKELINKNIELQGTEIVTIWNAHNRILANDVFSLCDLPPFRASIKDGYAVLAEDGKGRRRVLGALKAGSTATSVSLVPGACIRVNTGAPIPDDATAVVQVEDTKLILKNSDNTEEKEIEILTVPKEGQDIRPIGCDLQKGELVLRAPIKLGAAEVGLLAACGYKEVEVYKVPSVGVLSTGDELEEPGNDLKPGYVYDSNTITLISILRENGYDPKNLGIAKDDKASMVDAIKNALGKVDVLVTSGSVSMGDRDMLKPILEHYFNATIHFGRVNMKPGKPTTFATCTYNGKKKYFMCLPGNPVSATVTSILFVIPLLNEMHGDNSKPVIVRTKVDSTYQLDPRPEYARAILTWKDGADLPLAYNTGNQISSKLFSCKSANALLMLPGKTVAKTVLRPGEVVEAILLNPRTTM
uniref:gephyrin n=1 Tax=Vespula vulgaris TaxID=7454 RepID=UPI002125073C|nr:gephyrin [Vespula vulgaris]XP_050847335.1 gephyrin [Vespula vulgaris]